MDQTKVKIVYVITERNNRHFWNRVGVAFVNRDGSLNVKLEAVPVSGEFRDPRLQPARRRRPERQPQRQRHVRRAGRGVRLRRGASTMSFVELETGAATPTSKKSVVVEPGGGRSAAPASPGGRFKRLQERYRHSAWAPVALKAAGILFFMLALAGVGAASDLRRAGGARAHRRSRRGRHRLGVARRATSAQSTEEARQGPHPQPPWRRWLRRLTAPMPELRPSVAASRRTAR